MTTPENPVDPEEVNTEAEGVEAGTVTAAAEDSAAAAADEAGSTDAPSDEVAELTADLQRVTAEYANYRKRTARDVVDARAAGKAAVVAELLVVLDDLDRARSHGDLEAGPLKSVSDKLDGVLSGLGLAPFGAEGDEFDPSIHEAVQHEGDGADPVLGAVLRQGYQIDGKVIRNAMVAVVDRPEPDASGQGATDADQDES
ncbi:Protein GrpE OS=Tsukamurella paurometabola (strain ATCC 8368 / DSM / CCUG 35730 / CIP 100753/ JCM 10117 / KCTC 9821 / NBRC 16120 / NCIMB 702349 / NCTC 13040) OX=521096 GN=grpE PE=3 SV=1 [Tsukamurella paurometabola]|uniref:Protein GrpE n=1 Tax=Tsukamurella paurometabola (strain ATCC 8368 / DSM 20162 / CCUG 35730 / CIP 100753 / JCM 10117 / KCTC 9821 / NBRC 16120 / NCIMB 702349 / NCTC 13040) TaxID=521096 RepID=D5US61_TSUPD|nr:nucleotide exchange factor GrpE [Tsukamurella paurometabola]ADG77128.1 GrpE protein [Tsukamurella paurometabola DSM 20162]SUP42876.1 Heat shock protein B25.3 [Tsukamurella paurometabola]